MNNRETCRAEGIVFHPLEVEIFWRWEEGPGQIVKKMRQAIARATCHDDREVIINLFKII